MIQNGRRIFVVLGAQRSGTTALGRSLGTMSGITSFGEVFHDALAGTDRTMDESLRINREASFFSFKRQAILRSPELISPSPENQRYLFKEYIKYLFEIGKSKDVLVDIKYNCWHHFSPFYQSVIDSPYLFMLLKEIKAGFIHLKRHNLFARYCSEQLSLHSQQWHCADNQEVVFSDPIVIDPRAAILNMVKVQKQQAFFDSILLSVPSRIELQYEQLIAHQRFMAKPTEHLRRILKNSFDDKYTVHEQKINKDLKSRLANIDEITSYFDQTTFGSMVRQAIC